MTLSTLSVLSSLDCVPESSGNVDPKMICWVFQSDKEKAEKLFAWYCLLLWARLLAGRGWKRAVYS